MGKIKELINLFFTKKFISKFIAYWLLLLFFYLFKDFLGIFLLTFVFSYLFLTSSEFLKSKLDNFLLFNIKDQKRLKILKRFLGLNFIITFLYLIFIWIIVFILSNIIPQLTWELQSVEKIVWWANSIKIHLDTFTLNLNAQYNINLSEHLQNFYDTVDVGNIVNSITSYLRWAWKWFIYIIFSLVLSYIFILDRKRLQQYLFWIKNSTYWFLYKEYRIIFDKILKSFWLILKAQSLIAFANSIFTVIWLLIIWFFYHNAIWGYIFPYILTLWLIVFIAWFIPILWVFISSIPILLIAYLTIWWWTILISIILLIFIIHLIEAYYLNPKIVSSFLEIPVSLTFVILLISEQLFWIAWLIIWVSLFYFIVWLFRDVDKLFKKKKKKINEINAWFKKKAI
jgi:predicted PurR-regulated permease PerM